MADDNTLLYEKNALSRLIVRNISLTIPILRLKSGPQTDLMSKTLKPKVFTFEEEKMYFYDEGNFKEKRFIIEDSYPRYIFYYHTHTPKTTLTRFKPMIITNGGLSSALLTYGNNKYRFPDHRGYGKKDLVRVFTDVVDYAGKSNDVAGSGTLLDLSLFEKAYSFFLFDLTTVSDIKPTSNETLRLQVKYQDNVTNGIPTIGVLRQVQLNITNEGGRLTFNRIA